jgi:Flp pilus assembly protein TadB
VKIVAIIALLILGYALLAWALRRIQLAKRAADVAHQQELEQAAVQAKYLTPRMTETEIADMHASRWQGD